MANIIMIKIYSATCEHHNGLKNKYVVVYDNSTKRIYNIDKMCNKHKVFLNTSIMTHVEKNGAVYDKYEQPTETQATPTSEQPTEITDTANTTPETETQPTEEPTKYYDTDIASADVKYTLTGGFVGDAKETINNIYGMLAPEPEDCKTCISTSDCKYKDTLQKSQKCEMKQPFSMYIDHFKNGESCVAKMVNHGYMKYNTPNNIPCNAP